MKRFALTLAAFLFAAIVPLLAASFSEDFDCANADSLNCDVTWSEDAGDIDISSMIALAQTTGFGKSFARYTTSLASAEQYMGGTVSILGASVYAEFVFRYTDASSPYYGVIINAAEDTVSWNQWDNLADAAQTIIASSALTNTDGDVFGATISGTGNSTIVRVWKNPTGTPSAADNWNGDTTPDVTFTDDPGTAVNTGNNVGFQAFTNSGDDIGFYDILGGDFGGGGGGGSSPATLQLLGIGSR